ncbi:MAG: hypothetical protein Q8P07_00295 [bacterium]|nr:hypothetical protein [bacterium]
MTKEKFVVAAKDISSGEIRPGKVLGKFRKIEFALQAHRKLADAAGKKIWQTGIFQGGKLLE